jgi:hypothetical protein
VNFAIFWYETPSLWMKFIRKAALTVLWRRRTLQAKNASDRVISKRLHEKQNFNATPARTYQTQVSVTGILHPCKVDGRFYDDALSGRFSLIGGHCQCCAVRSPVRQGYTMYVSCSVGRL